MLHWTHDDERVQRIHHGRKSRLGERLATCFASEGRLVFAGQRNLAQSSAPVLNVSDRMTLLAVDVLRGRAKPGTNVGCEVLDFDGIQLTSYVNAIGPWRVTQAFLLLLEQGARKLVINVSSEMGSPALLARPFVRLMHEQGRPRRADHDPGPRREGKAKASARSPLTQAG
jgi:hypothetical protein